MQSIKSRFILAVAAAAVAVPAAVLANDVVTTYGRAGGAVGADRINELQAVRPSSASNDVNTWYGRAGGPVGVARADVATTPKAYAAGESKQPTVHGRAGVPLPFGG